MLEYNLKQTLIKFWNKAKQTFALNTELAQSDWDQNDDTQIDYVKNRTHWVERPPLVPYEDVPLNVDFTIDTWDTTQEGNIYTNTFDTTDYIDPEIFEAAIGEFEPHTDRDSYIEVTLFGKKYKPLRSDSENSVDLVLDGSDENSIYEIRVGINTDQEDPYVQLQVFSTEELRETDCSIVYYGEEVVHKIDPKFLPEVSVPTHTSDLINDGSDGTSQYMEADDLAVVASTGEYGDLSNTPTKLSEFINDGSDGTSQYVEADDLAVVASTGDYGDLSNTPTKLSEFINDGNGDILSNPFVTQEDIGEIQDLISTEASAQNKLISQSEAEEIIQTLSLSPIVADNTGTKSFDFESVMYSSMVPDSTNLEAGPWYKNEGSGFVECGSTSGVYVGLNDSAVVLNDESLFYYFAHGCRYQRIKIGVVGVYGKIKTPYGENVDLIYSDGTDLSGKFAGVSCIYFYDDHNQFGHNSRVIYICRISNLVSKTNAAEEYLMANVTDTINNIAAGTDPDASYDIIYPTTKYVCTQAQTASSDPVWTYLFTINDTTFSNEEWAVLKSKATKEKIEQIETNKQTIESLADVAFSGDYDDLENKLEVEVLQSTTTDGQKQYKRTQIMVNGVTTTVDVPVVDSTLSPSSQNPVQNNVIQHELANKLPVERFNELDSIALTTLGIKSGVILEPVKTITEGKRYPNVTQSGSTQWRLSATDNDTFYKIYNVSQYDVVHLTATSRTGYILTESLPNDFETRVMNTGSGDIYEYPEPSETPAGTHSEQANIQPYTGYTPYDLDITTNGRPYLIVYEGDFAQAIVVSYGGGYSPIKTSMFVNDGEGGSPLDPYVTSSDLVASQSDLNYILGN